MTKTFLANFLAGLLGIFIGVILVYFLFSPSTHLEKKLMVDELCLGGICRSSWPTYANFTDTRCDTPEECSQLCIGEDCRSEWPETHISCTECEHRFVNQFNDSVTYLTIDNANIHHLRFGEKRCSKLFTDEEGNVLCGVDEGDKVSDYALVECEYQEEESQGTVKSFIQCSCPRGYELIGVLGLKVKCSEGNYLKMLELDYVKATREPTRTECSYGKCERVYEPAPFEDAIYGYVDFTSPSPCIFKSLTILCKKIPHS